MRQFSITSKSKPGRQVIVTEDNGRYAARLYVGGDTGTLTCWNGKTEKGARKFAEKVLAA